MTELDLRGLKCPQPMLRTKKALAHLPSGSLVTIWATDAGTPDDFTAFCRHTGHELLESSVQNDTFKLVIKRK